MPFLTPQPHLPLLADGDPLPVHVARPGGRSAYLLLSDHAGRQIPQRLGDLGVPPAAMDRHIAWDIGIAGVGARLSDLLDAVLIEQRYSRLVIDCNRPPGHPTSIPALSDGTPIPGNAGLASAAAQARVRSIFHPYHDAIAAELDRRDARPGTCTVIALHSFTPVFGGVPRPWHAGVLYGPNPAFAIELGQRLRKTGLLVGDNEPYRYGGGYDYTVPTHAEPRALPYVELEIRQDLIADEPGQRHWADLLARALLASP